MNARAFAVVIYFVINFKLCQGEKYRNYKLISVNPVNKDQLKYLRNLDSEKYMDIVFFEKPYQLGQPIQLIVSPQHLTMFKERAEHFNIDYEILMSDVQTAFDGQERTGYRIRHPEDFTFNYYHYWEDIYQWLSDLSNNRSVFAEHYSIGKSKEGRDISVVNINLQPGSSKPKVVIEGGIHGHEWPSIVFVTYMINELAGAQTSEDNEWRRLAMAYDWYLVPVLNPDGFAYTHKQDRLWMKNRNGNNSVNLNRNFDSNFGTFDSSSDPRHDNYRGPQSFSEAESKALLGLIWPMRTQLRYYFAIHSYGQRIIIPYEDRIQHLENFGEMENYSRQAIHKLFLRNHNVRFSTGTMYDLLGVRMSGTSTSWVKKAVKVKYVYTIQVRDTGAYGFALPSTQLPAMCTETKLIIQELMTTKPRHIRALFEEDDANINTLYIPSCEGKRYDGFMLLRGLPENEDHLEFFKNVTKNYEVNVWQAPGLVNKPVDFIISPGHAELVQAEARSQNISLVTLNTDIQRALDNQTVTSYSRRNTKSFNWESYHRAGDIINWMRDLKSQFPEEISLYSIGKSVEGRDIMCMKIIFRGSARRSKVVIEGGIHAREWISTAMVTYLINELVHARKGVRDKSLKEIAYQYEWFIIPIFNIDGYEYTHTTDRMWRKNRRGGYGVDVNRNFDAAFGTVGVEMIDKSSEEYCGPKPFSEPESQSMKNFMEATSQRLPISHYISFHSYGQLFIIPYAYTKKHLENFNEMKKIGDRAAARIRKRYGTQYTVGTAFDTVGYMAAGVSACWAKKTFHIPYVNVFELRDAGDHGFALPAYQIKPTCLETMDGLMEVLKPRQGTKLTGPEDLAEPDGQTRVTLNVLMISINVFLIWFFGF